MYIYIYVLHLCIGSIRLLQAPEHVLQLQAHHLHVFERNKLLAIYTYMHIICINNVYVYFIIMCMHICLIGMHIYIYIYICIYTNNRCVRA